MPIEEWDILKQKYQEINGDEEELPQWQKDIIDQRDKLINQPGQLMSLEDFLRRVEEEADEEV